MSGHKNLIDSDIHALTARTYTDITARDADTPLEVNALPFFTTENIDKVVRVNSSPVSYYILSSIGPIVWDEFTDVEIAIDIATNTIHRGSDGKDHSDVVLNNTHRNSDGKDHSDVVLNNAHRISDGKDHSDVVFNNTHRTSDGKDHSDVVLNNIHRISDGTDHSFIDQNVTISASPTFVQVTVGNTGLVVGTSTPLSDNAGVLTLQNIDALDSITEATIESAIDTLANLTSIQGKTISLGNSLTIESANPVILNQDLTTDANVDFNNLTLAGDLTVQGTTTTIDSTTLLVEDKNIEIGVVATPTDITADGGGITLKASSDITIKWLNATNSWTFNQSIDLLANNLLTSGSLLSGRVIVDNIDLDGNTITTLSGDLDIITNTGGVFKFVSNAIRAGQDASNYLEIGHGGSNSFINSVGAGNMDFRFGGVNKASFTPAGHLHLKTDTDQKHNLKIKTANNANASGIAWENSGGNFSQTIFRTDVGSNRSDLVFAIGSDANIDQLTNSFKIHGEASDEGKLEILGAFQISSGNPGTGKVLTSDDSTGITSWTLPAVSGWTNGGTVVRLTTFTDNVGIGISTPDGKLHVHAGTSGAVTASSVANALVVEDSTNNGISILTPDASSGRIIFGSPSDPFGAFMAWSFSVDDFVVGSSKIGANFRLTSDQETTNLTLSGGSGSELATFAKDVTISGNIKITGGTPGIDEVLTSLDVDGNASWQPLPQSVGWIGGGGVLHLSTGTDNVGIGTQTPDTKLHVETGNAGTVTAFVGTIATFESLGAGYLSILTPDASTSGILFGEPSSNVAGGIFYNDPGSPDGFQFRVDGNQTKMVIEKDGAVGIGTTNPDVTAILDLNSTTKGFLPPRMTTTQRDAISSPLAGLEIHNTTIDKSEVFIGTSWKVVLTEDLGTFTAQEVFASINVRFFGEFGVPQDQGWTDTATGIATIDLQDQTVFGVLKQVVRHNDNTGGGSTTSKIALTAQNWIDINNFGASYSGISRLDTINGASGFFSGLQANSAENPLATGNRRYGILFDNNAGNLRIIEADNNPGNSVTMDGTGGNPSILFNRSNIRRNIRRR